ncbi:MAG: hypothetical protein M2R45_01144 [Verrucomicrobia subdivision 3 bacterium]|nr:hypothetical protein [Limisphaerales bacterium]MCS1415302.1 hypothetical protein [Limisphaerales bacterium]
MRQRELLFAAGGALLAVIVMLGVFRSQRGAVEEASKAAEASGAVDSPPPPGGSSGAARKPKLAIPDAGEISASRARFAANRAERERLMQESPDDYYDFERVKAAFRNGGDEAYRKKVHYHNRVVSYLHSKRKDDLAFRRVMVLLLANGYGLEEWRIVTGVLGNWQQDVAWQRRALESSNLFSPEEIEEELRWVKEQQEERFRRLPRQLKFTANITDPELIRTLWEVDVGLIEPGDGSFGHERHKTVWGDKLLTEEDWLTDEFRAARARYTGPPRERMSYHLMRAEFPKMALPEGVQLPDFDPEFNAAETSE